MARDVHKWFGELHVLRGIDLTVRTGEVVVIFGASGSGKSTFIRTINRLEEHQRGEITVDGIELTNDVRNIAAVRREIGMVFQSFNLFPHLTVMRNITLAPMRVRGWSRAQAEEDRHAAARAGRDPGAGGEVPGAAVRGPAATGRDRPRAGHAARRSCCSTSPPLPSIPR